MSFIHALGLVALVIVCLAAVFALGYPWHLR